MQELNEILNELKKEMPYKWRVQSFSRNYPTAQCVAYIDARDVMDRLDACCEWKDRYYEVCGNLYCEIAIKVGDEWVSRSDCGTESKVEADKGQASDAFKRAAVKFGVGRFLYSLKIMRVRTSNKQEQGKPYPFVVDNSGNRVNDLTTYINNLK